LGIRVKIDNDETKRPGFKFAEYEMVGIPVRIGIGARDLAVGKVEVARRDTKEKMSLDTEGVALAVQNLLDEIQQNLFDRAVAFRTEMTAKADTMAELEQILTDKGGFVLAHWDESTETADKIKDLTGATIRCIPLDSVDEAGACILTSKPSKRRVLFARAY
jgi:prolyl-tRNA synthetase